MRTAFQYQVDTINDQLELLPEQWEFEDFLNGPMPELSSKANKNTIKQIFISPMNALIQSIKKIATEQKTIMDRT